MWDVFKCTKSSPEVLHAIVLVRAKIDAPTVSQFTYRFRQHHSAPLQNRHRSKLRIKKYCRLGSVEG
jgi:hypothetical protein